MKRYLCLALFAALCTLTGCGGGGATVDGKLVDGGSAYSLAEGESITLTLTSEDGKNTCSANVEKDGTFIGKTTGGQALPPGRYKVTMIHYRAIPNSKDPPKPPSPKDTGEVWDVSSSSKSFTLDMAKFKDPKKK